LEDKEYIYFPSFTVGGPPGQYTARCPIPSDAAYAEFCIVGVSNFGGASATAIISGIGPVVDLDFTATGVALYNDQSAIQGQLHRLNQQLTNYPNETWDRIANPLGAVFISVGNKAGTAPNNTLVTLKFRVKVLNRIPRPALTVEPSEESQYNQERARRVEAAVLGREGEYEIYGQSPRTPGTTREIETGESIIKGSQRMFKGRGQ